MTTQAKIDNQLVNQKNLLLNILSQDTIPHMKRVLAGLELVREMWIDQGYGYKINEILARIEVQAVDQLEKLPKQERRMRQQLGQIRAICTINRVGYDELI